MPRIRSISAFLALCALIGFVRAASPARPPTVKLGDATVIGITEGPSTSFLGIPFAQPPVGRLRLQLPRPIARHTGIINATAFGNQCIQQKMDSPALPPNVPPELRAFVEPMGTPLDIPQSEDCLNLNVIVPAGTRPGAKLPIAVWFYGGGFQVGSNAVRPGAAVVNRSIEINQPVIFVSMNYRLSAYGFLGGKEIQQAGLGNLGLHDQREALRWVNKHIKAFGGDPTKVTIWGQSAGSRSVNYQMITNNGDTEGLFRAAWMESGSALSTSDFSSLQPNFDFIVSETGCSGARDPLVCLREVPTERFTAAMDKTPAFLSFTSLVTPYMPKADGVFLTDNPQKLIIEGRMADIPFVSSNCEDEGTLFSLSSLNLTTNEEAETYIKDNFFPNASDTAIARLFQLYPADPAAGSPFGTGDAFAFTPGFKRISAFQGDLFYQGTRRFLLSQRAGKQKSVVRAFFNERNKIPGLGATHTTELPNIFGGGDLTDLFVRFVNTLDPNGGPQIHWPAYTTESPELLGFVEGETPLRLIRDTFRKEGTDFLTDLTLAVPL